MTTTLQLALVAGALIGLGAALLIAAAWVSALVVT